MSLEPTEIQKTTITTMATEKLQEATRLLKRLAIVRTYREEVALVQIFEGLPEAAASLKCQDSLKVWKLDEDELAQRYFNPLYDCLTAEVKKREEIARLETEEKRRQELEAYLTAGPPETTNAAGPNEHIKHERIVGDVPHY